jgi:hypothetical protein
MLGGSNAEQLIDEVWEKLSCNVQLPESWDDEESPTGPKAAQQGDERRYRRFHLRGRAVLELNGKYFAVFTKDISRSGLAFLCEQQLFPCQKAGVWFASRPRGEIKIARCRRIGERCYECGANFVT